MCARCVHDLKQAQTASVNFEGCPENLLASLWTAPCTGSAWRITCAFWPAWTTGTKSPDSTCDETCSEWSSVPESHVQLSIAVLRARLHLQLYGNARPSGSTDPCIHHYREFLEEVSQGLFTYHHSCFNRCYEVRCSTKNMMSAKLALVLQSHLRLYHDTSVPVMSRVPHLPASDEHAQLKPCCANIIVHRI
jgi:hypothetical protein